MTKPVRVCPTCLAATPDHVASAVYLIPVGPVRDAFEEASRS